MNNQRGHGMKWLLPMVFIAVSGCAPDGGAVVMATSAAGGGDFTAVPSQTPLPPEATFTPTPTYTLIPTPSLSATAIAAGRRHTCVITNRMTVKCWGENEDGQLGDETTVLKTAPVDVQGLDESVTAIAAGYNHTCALTVQGDVYCWGNNAFGQVGDGTQTSRSTPVKVPLPGTTVAISAGTLHTCATNGRDVYCWGVVEYLYLEGEDVMGIALDPYRIDVSNIRSSSPITSIGSGFAHDCVLTDQGSVYCWGRNDLGQLGQGEASYATNVPQKVRGFIDPVKGLAVGGSHTCVIQYEDTVSCWGYNKYGQLGNAFAGEVGWPTEVEGLQHVIDVTAGAYHTCAVVSDGGAKCWGDNRYYQLGIEQKASGKIVDVAGNFRSIAAGGSHTCALTENGGVSCWGNNKFGQLGEGLTPPTPTPSQMGAEGTELPTSTLPPSTGHTNRAASIAAGRSHTCAVTTAGGVKCWGKNEHGELGNGTWSDSSVPAEVAGLSSGIAKVAAGWGHTCVVTVSGGVKCWGYNRNGELGNGANSDSNKPVDVRGLESGVESIEAADDHTCAILTSGAVKCWGYNLYGQLGDGTAVDRNTPVEVTGLTNGAVDVVAGWGHTCVLTPQGGVKCWGNNHYGQVGNGSDKENYHTPVNVAGLAGGVTHISADGGQTCALTDKGLVMCWGNNKYGQLGDGTAEPRKTPVVVVGLKLEPGGIAAGWNHTCAVDISRNMYCWGWNYYGQLGNGIRTTSTKPVKAGEMMYGVLHIAAGWGHTCVITDIDTVQCWGLNEFGQLGDGTTEDAYLPVDVLGFSL